MSTSGRGARASSRSATRRISPWPGRNTRSRARLVGERRRASRARPGPRSRRRIAAEIARLDRKGAALALDHRRIAEQAAHPRAVERRRHDEEAQVLAQRRPARRAPARGRDRRRASARGTRRTAPPRRRRARDRRGSCRAKTPSVTTSMRVRAETRLCSRTRKPTVSPTFRRGSRPCARGGAGGKAARLQHDHAAARAQGSSSSASGTRVVLPAPGGATSTARVCVRERRRARAGPRRSAAGRRGRAHRRFLSGRSARVQDGAIRARPIVAASAVPGSRCYGGWRPRDRVS